MFADTHLKARCYRICDKSLSHSKINLTNDLSVTANQNIANRVFMHYTSPKCMVTNSFTIKPFDDDFHFGKYYNINLLVIVSNSSPLNSLGNNTHWYSTANLQFRFHSFCNPIQPPPINPIGFYENQLNPTNTIKVYPNPSNHLITIQLSSNSSPQNTTIHLFDVLGKQVFSVKSQSNRSEIDISQLKSGIYFIKVSNETRMIGTAKIVKD